MVDGFQRLNVLKCNVAQYSSLCDDLSPQTQPERSSRVPGNRPLFFALAFLRDLVGYRHSSVRSDKGPAGISSPRSVRQKKPLMNSKSLAAPVDHALLASSEAHLRVLRQFRQVFSSVRNHFQIMEKRVGIGGAPIWAMSLIAKTPGIGVTKLAHAMDIHQSTASNLVKSLVKSGLIVSEKSAQDRRVVELYPLPAGLKLLKKVPGPYTGVLPQALRELNEETLCELERLLAILIERMNTDERSAKTPISMM